MRRRDFLAGLGGATATWPLAARAQQRERMRRVGVLLGGGNTPEDPQSQARNAALLQGLAQQGWIVGRNLQIDMRWAGRDNTRHPGYVAEMLANAPEVIVAVGASIVPPLLAATRTVPIVFVQVTDPVGSGFVSSLARPGGNATGFSLFEFGISAKWLELLKEIAPRTTRVAVLLDSAAPTGFGQLGAMQAVAPSMGIEISPVNPRDWAEIEPAVAEFARGANNGMIILPGPQSITRRPRIVAVAAQHKLPAVYPYRYFVTGGGLICYGPDELKQYLQAATYVDRILKGEKPSELPVQVPTKYELAINLKTAKALGLAVQPTLIARADEVIE